MSETYLNGQPVQIRYNKKLYFISPNSSFEDIMEAALPQLRAKNEYNGWSDADIIADVMVKIQTKNIKNMVSHYNYLNTLKPGPNLHEWGQYTYEEILNMHDNGCTIPDEVLEWARAQANEDVVNYQIDDSVMTTNNDLAIMESDLNNNKTVASKQMVILYSEKAKSQDEEMQKKYQDINNKNNELHTKQTDTISEKKDSANKILSYKKELDNLEQKVSDGEPLSVSEQLRYSSLSGKIEKENNNIVRNTEDMQSDIELLFKSIDDAKHFSEINEQFSNELEHKNSTFVNVESRSNAGTLPVVNENRGFSNNPYLYMALSGQLFANTIDLSNSLQFYSDITNNATANTVNFITNIENIESQSNKVNIESPNNKILKPEDNTNEDDNKSEKTDSGLENSKNNPTENNSTISDKHVEKSENKPPLETFTDENSQSKVENITSPSQNYDVNDMPSLQQADTTNVLDESKNIANPQNSTNENVKENNNIANVSQNQDKSISDSNILPVNDNINNDKQDTSLITKDNPVSENILEETNSKMNVDLTENSNTPISLKNEGAKSALNSDFNALNIDSKENMDTKISLNSEKNNKRTNIERILNSINSISRPDNKEFETLINKPNEPQDTIKTQLERDFEIEDSAKTQPVNRTNIVSETSKTAQDTAKLSQPEITTVNKPKPDENLSSDLMMNPQKPNNINIDETSPNETNNTNLNDNQSDKNGTNDNLSAEKLLPEPPKTETEENPDIQMERIQRTAISDTEVIMAAGNIDEINNNSEEVQQVVSAQIQDSKPEYLKNPMLSDDTDNVSEEVTLSVVDEAKQVEKHNLTKQEPMQKVKEAVKETMQATLSSVNQKVQSKDSDNDKKHKMFTRFEIEKQDAIRKTVQKISNAKDAR